MDDYLSKPLRFADLAAALQQSPAAMRAVSSDASHQEASVVCREKISGFRQLEEESGQTVLVVSHGNAIAAMLSEMLHMPIESSWSFAVENTSLTRMEISKSGRLTLLGFNDASHIHGLDEAAG